MRKGGSGKGVDLFALVWSACDKKLYALNSGGWAPAAWTPQFFTEKLGAKSVPGSGVNSATVPGAISGYDALLKRFGTMSFDQTFERAARIAEEGWGQAERRRHGDLRSSVKALLAASRLLPSAIPSAGALDAVPRTWDFKLHVSRWKPRVRRVQHRIRLRAGIQRVQDRRNGR